MSSIPQTLASVDPSSDWHAYLYTHVSSSTGFEVYQLFAGSTAVADTEIKVNTVTNVWEDGSSAGNPTNVTEVNGVIHLTSSSGSNQNKYKFNKPPASSWSSSGGTGTESLSPPSEPQGSLRRSSHTNIRVVIDKSSPSTSSSDNYVVQRDGVSQGPGITHTQNSTTDFVQNLTYSPGVWKLWHQGTSDDTLLGSYASGTKVHCNFW